MSVPDSRTKLVDPNLPVFLELAIEGISLPARVHECPVLHCGFTQRTDGENPLYVARHIPKESSGGKLGISIFNLPEIGRPETGLNITNLSLKVSFAASRNDQKEATPFSQITFDSFLIYKAPLEQDYSYAFRATADEYPDEPGRHQVWNVFFDNSASAAAYPSDQLQGGASGPSESDLMPIEVEDGAFFVTVVLDVELNYQRRVTFRVDPEMIVQTGEGSPPPYPDKSKGKSACKSKD